MWAAVQAGLAKLATALSPHSWVPGLRTSHESRLGVPLGANSPPTLSRRYPALLACMVMLPLSCVPWGPGKVSGQERAGGEYPGVRLEELVAIGVLLQFLPPIVLQAGVRCKLRECSCSGHVGMLKERYHPPIVTV